MDEEKLRRAESALEALSSQIGATTTGLKSSALAREREILQLQKLLGIEKAQAQALQAELELEKKIYDQEQKALELSKRRSRDLVDGVQQILGGVKDFASGAMSATQSMYHSKEVFTAVTPTLDLLANAAKTVANALATMTSSIPFLGNILGGAAQLGSALLELAVQADKIKLENAQHLLNSFQKISSTGVIFSGNMEDLSEIAHNAGVSVETYTEFVTKSAAGLAQFSGSVESGAAFIGQMGQTVATLDKKLVGIYGGYDQINDALADYTAVMSGYGIDITKNNKMLTDGSSDYLYRLKELSNLTGESVDALEKQERARQDDLLYQMKLQQIVATYGAQGSANIQTAQALLERYMPGAGKILQEAIERGGTRYMQNPENVALLAQLGPNFANMIDALRTASLTSKDATGSFGQIFGSFVSKGLPALQQQYQGMANMGQAYPPLIQQLLAIVSGATRNASAMGNLTAAQAKIAGELGKPATDTTKKIAELYRQLEDIKVSIDKDTMGSIGELAKTADKLYGFQKELIDKFGPLFDYSVTLFNKGVNKLLDALGVKNYTGNAGGSSNSDGRWHPPGESVAPSWYNELFGIGTQTPVGPDVPMPNVSPFAGASGTPTTAPNAYGQPATPGKSKASLDDVREMIAKGESNGDYNAIYGGKNAKLTTMTLQQVYDLQDQLLKNTNHSPVGKYQFIKPTLQSLAQQLGFGPNTVFTQQVQDQLADLLIYQQGFPAYQSGLTPKEQFLAQLKSQWDSLPAPGSMQFQQQLAMLAKGGVTNGPSIAGEAGPEAVVPLPDGRTIPVKMDTGDLIDKLDEMIRVLKDHKNISEKQLYANA